MKAMAAVSIRQYERAVESLAEYNRTIEMGLQILMGNRPALVDMIKPEPAKRIGLVVFGSDQGMCGQLNDQIVYHAGEAIENFGVAKEDRFILAVGLRVAVRLEDAGNAIAETLSVPASTSGITPMVQETVMILEDWQSRENVNYIVLCYSQHLSSSVYRPYTQQILPLDIEWLRGLANKEWPARGLPAYTAEWDRLFASLVRQYLFVSIYRAFAESLASENASRLASMQGAQRNIEERLTELTTQFNQQRQMSVTEELLDIVSGFTALTTKKTTL
jgi:F-type H+-transporting ATPase subunit gamma